MRRPRGQLCGKPRRQAETRSFMIHGSCRPGADTPLRKVLRSLHGWRARFNCPASFTGSAHCPSLPASRHRLRRRLLLLLRDDRRLVGENLLLIAEELFLDGQDQSLVGRELILASDDPLLVLERSTCHDGPPALGGNSGGWCLAAVPRQDPIRGCVSSVAGCSVPVILGGAILRRKIQTGGGGGNRTRVRVREKSGLAGATFIASLGPLTNSPTDRRASSPSGGQSRSSLWLERRPRRASPTGRSRRVHQPYRRRGDFA